MKAFYTALCFFFLLPFLAAQMPQPDGSVRYGHEWIGEEGGTYLRVAVAEDGAYRIDPSQLATLGWSATGPEADRLQLWHQGERVPIYVNEQGVHFFGEQNRGEFDRYLFEDPDAQQLNPRYSMFTDTAVYYLGVLPVGEMGMRFVEAMQEPEAGAPEVPYVWRVSELVWGDYAIKALTRVSGSSIYYSHFETAEGYGSRSESDLLKPTNDNTLTNFSITAPNAQAATEPATLKLRFGVGFDQHQQLLSLDNVETDSFVNIGWAVHAGQWDVSAAALSDAKLAIELRGMGGDRDKASVAFAELRYPAAPNTAGSPFFSFDIPASTQPQTLQLAGLPGSGIARLFDRSTGRYYTAPLEGGVARFGLPAFAELHQFVLVTESGWQATAALVQPIVFPEMANSSVDFLILTSERLRNAGSAVAEYAAYRGSPAGGGYRVRVANVEDIYERHGYGIARHPQAIRNYLQWVRSEHPELKYFLIIGKGREYPLIRRSEHLSGAGATFQVPTFGYPGSDILLSSDARDGTLATLATGRIPAVNDGEVAIYLEKLRTSEAQRNAPQTLAGKGWMKNVLHLGGGSQPWEQNLIRGQLESMEDIVERGKFGGAVQGVYKTSTEPIQSSRLDQAFEIINGGTSLVTFFGHSSPGNFELRIDTPENYDNAGRCPLMLSLGCYSGNHFIRGRSVGEGFLFLPQRGAIGFGSSNSFGFIPSLSFLGRKYYENLSGPYYGAGMGEILRVTLLDMVESGSDLLSLSLAEQFNLQGDPAFKLHAQSGPDFVFNPEAIRLNPSVPNAQSDSFSVEYQIVNIGENLPIDSLSIRFRQKTPAGLTKELGERTVALNGAVNDLVTRLPNLGGEAIGNNLLFIDLDAKGEIPELPLPDAETNNSLTNANGQEGLPFFVVSNTAFPVFPPRYALVGEEAPVLKVSTSNPLAPSQNYLFQLDTSLAFTQPLAATEMIADGGLLEWRPDVAWQDSTVYYWRVSPDSVADDQIGLIWESSSFLYLSETPNGWGQGHHDQWLDNEHLQIDLKPGRQPVFAFADNTLKVELRNQVRTSSGRPYYINDDQSVRSPWTWSVWEGVNVIVLSYPKLEYWRNQNPGDHESINSSDFSGGVLPFGYPTLEAKNRGDLINFLEHIVPDSFYVIVYTAQHSKNADYEPQEWAADSLLFEGKNIFNVLEKQGATQIRRTEQKGAIPYALMYQKGIGTISEQLADSLDGYVLLQHSFVGKWFEGQFTTVPVGPAKSWQRIRMHYFDSSLPTASDSSQLTLFGIREDGTETILQTISPLAPDTDYDISNIDAGTYPRLRLRLFFLDEEYRTVPPIRNLIVYYEGLPDLAITDSELLNPADTLRQGESWGLTYRVVNISPYDITQTLGQYTLGNVGRLDGQTSDLSLPALASGESWLDTITLSTDSLFQVGNFGLRINSENQPPEHYRFNNVLTTGINIRRDRIDPVVSVAFDGRSILDGDIVAANPNISIVLTDENQLLRLDRPELMQVWVKSPVESDFTLIPPTEYQFTAAPTEGENRASILFQPIFTEDGTYQLRVAAEDWTGNPAGASLYEVNFEVITRKTLSNVLPYPNPFTTSTRFVYTLTGEEPTDFRIQIMTVSGRIVREITKFEIGPLYIGTHQTEYAWDGRDEYGDQLANGVYLYRVIAQDENREDYELRGNGTEQYFQNGIGKLVLLR